MHTSAHLPHPTVPGVLRRLRALLVGVLAAAAGLVGVVVLPTTANAASDTAPVAAGFEAQVLAATNAARRSHGLRPLRATSCTDRYAVGWTRHLASRDRMYHQPLRPIMRACNLRTAAENLAWRSGSLTAQQVVAMWMASPGHRRNILTPRLKYLGVGAWRSTDMGRVYVGQVFGG
jgi:uncharacterized protein YkwD